MSKLFYKAMVEDVQHEQCTHREIDFLLDIFLQKMKRIAVTGARKSWFQLSDFVRTKEEGVDRFTFTLERVDVRQQEQWWGVFECGQKTLRVIGSLEKC